MTYTIYEPNGKITGTYSSSVEEYVTQYLADKLYIEGEYSNDYYITDGVAVLKPANPSVNELSYDFNYDTKQWELNLPLTEHRIKNTRSILLEAVDRVNPLWYASMSEQQKAELAAYRQALLDITKQPGYPLSIEWPVKPQSL
jgi:hypothetical protein